MTRPGFHITDFDPGDLAELVVVLDEALAEDRGYRVVVQCVMARWRHALAPEGPFLRLESGPTLRSPRAPPTGFEPVLPP